MEVGGAAMGRTRGIGTRVNGALLVPVLPAGRTEGATVRGTGIGAPRMRRGSARG